ncbi:hypothetical protein CXG81DRAFT_18863 [Caulochytrium protostelioides]|uniref:BHLH domain-containing protein n=1 Tax=Caulochytrium protostelioides TaxID=1555241 RepID=A0A4P9X7V1_9FUNG|nr:hypothetical protein CXG81DRAFT_18863 [Caulochytrium protostelioides]|eukprot:RKP01336.1 hypothetical protein CXG81DRAFT_18863 [Caulochytrium protostelioides]
MAYQALPLPPPGPGGHLPGHMPGHLPAHLPGHQPGHHVDVHGLSHALHPSLGLPGLDDAAMADASDRCTVVGMTPLSTTPSDCPSRSPSPPLGVMPRTGGKPRGPRSRSKALRQNHNALERLRRSHQREQIEALRQCLPVSEYEQRTSTITIVQAAAAYIGQLQHRIARLEQQLGLERLDSPPLMPTGTPAHDGSLASSSSPRDMDVVTNAHGGGGGGDLTPVMPPIQRTTSLESLLWRSAKRRHHSETLRARPASPQARVPKQEAAETVMTPLTSADDGLATPAVSAYTRPDPFEAFALVPCPSPIAAVSGRARVPQPATASSLAPAQALESAPVLACANLQELFGFSFDAASATTTMTTTIDASGMLVDAAAATGHGAMHAAVLSAPAGRGSWGPAPISPDSLHSPRSTPRDGAPGTGSRRRRRRSSLSLTQTTAMLVEATCAPTPQTPNRMSVRLFNEQTLTLDVTSDPASSDSDAERPGTGGAGRVRRLSRCTLVATPRGVSPGGFDAHRLSGLMMRPAGDRVASALETMLENQVAHTAAISTAARIAHENAAASSLMFPFYTDCRKSTMPFTVPAMTTAETATAAAVGDKSGELGPSQGTTSHAIAAAADGAMATTTTAMLALSDLSSQLAALLAPSG